MSVEGKIGATAKTLGYAGLIPQILATAAIGVARWAGYECPITRSREVVGIAMVYPWLILAFLGGTWWGFAVRRTSGQDGVLAISVVPSIVALGIAVFAALTWRFDQALVVTGIAVMLTLIVDRWLVRSGDAPTGWMALRMPLSLALGLCTIAAGVLCGPVSAYCMSRL